MTFVENFEKICRSRGESPSHALEAVNLSRSLYSRWKNNPDRPPYGATVQKLANYFGCSFQDLEPGLYVKEQTATVQEIAKLASQLDEKYQQVILRYIQFTFGKELIKEKNDEMQTV